MIVGSMLKRFSFPCRYSAGDGGQKDGGLRPLRHRDRASDPQSDPAQLKRKIIKLQGRIYTVNVNKMKEVERRKNHNPFQVDF